MERAATALDRDAFREKLERLRTVQKQTGTQKPEKDGTTKHVDYDVLERRGIYRRFWDVTAESVSRTCPAECRRQWLEVCEYIKDMDYNLSVGKGLMLIGPVGTMKTTMAVAVLRDLIERDPNQGYFIPMVSLLDQLNEERDSRSHILEDRIRHTRLLVLDDLGAEYDHAWVAAKIDSIVTERYNRMKSTIVTSNLRRDEIRDRYQMRIFDRLKSTNKLITFAGKSLRRTV